MPDLPTADAGLLHPGELPPSARKGLVGLVYLQAVSAIAGYDCTAPVTDYNCIDAIVSSKTGISPKLDFQVKCTSVEMAPEATDFSYDLPVRTYDVLRHPHTMCPRYLLVVVVPSPSGDWIRFSERRLNFRRCGYYASLRGLPPTDNQYTIAVTLERANRLTPEALGSLMRAAEEEWGRR